MTAEDTISVDAEAGGLGGRICDPASGTRDTRLIRRAIEEGWPVRPELRAKVIDRAAEVISNPDAAPRNIVAASKIVLAADGLNLQAERLAQAGTSLSVNVGVVAGASVAECVRQAIGTEPEYLEWLRRRATGIEPLDNPDYPMNH